MTKKEIYQLLNNGYKEMCASGTDNPFLVFYTNVGMSLIYVLCGMAKRYREEEYLQLKESFDKQIKNMGGETKSFLVLSVDSSANDYTEQIAIAKQVCSENQFSWIYDDYLNELICYETQVEEFYGLKRVLEGASQVSDSEAEQIIEKEYFDGPDGRTLTKKQTIPKTAIVIAITNLLIFIACQITGDLLYNMFAGISPLFGNISASYRVVTAMFIHENLYHFFSNMILLVVVAFNIEEILKPTKFLLIYFVSGILGNIAELLSAYVRGEDIMCYGASGAVFGMVGAYVSLLIFNKARNRYANGMWISLGLAAMVLTGAFTANIAQMAHIMGLLSGLIISMIICLCSKKKDKGRTNEN